MHEFWSQELDSVTKTYNYVKCIIPEKCCGKKVVIADPGSLKKKGWFQDCCDHHMTTYEDVIKYFRAVPQNATGSTTTGGDLILSLGTGVEDTKVIPNNIKYGYTCCNCMTYNEYATANKPNDKFMCWNCSH